jgi:outer membrane biosynthesis protein TonB
MNRLLAILVTLFILFLVYLWINHLMGSSAHANSVDDPSSAISGEQQYDQPEEVYDIPDDVPVQEDPVSEPENEYVAKDLAPETTNAPAQQEQKAEPKPVSKPVEPQVKKTVVPPPTSTPPETKATSNGGTHLVIAGNFIARANAEERVKELKKLGYSKAEVVNFELSEYHTACAGRYSDLNEARRVAKKIKDMHAIDTYVRHGN